MLPSSSSSPSSPSNSAVCTAEGEGGGLVRLSVAAALMGQLADNAVILPLFAYRSSAITRSAAGLIRTILRCHDPFFARHMQEAALSDGTFLQHLHEALCGGRSQGQAESKGGAADGDGDSGSTTAGGSKDTDYAEQLLSLYSFDATHLGGNGAETKTGESVGGGQRGSGDGGSGGAKVSVGHGGPQVSEVVKLLCRVLPPGLTSLLKAPGINADSDDSPSVILTDLLILLSYDVDHDSLIGSPNKVSSNSPVSPPLPPASSSHSPRDTGGVGGAGGAREAVEATGVEEGSGWGALAAAIRCDHHLPLLIWNESTRAELARALADELEVLDRKARLLGGGGALPGLEGRMSWNYVDFAVRYVEYYLLSQVYIVNRSVSSGDGVICI